MFFWPKLYKKMTNAKKNFSINRFLDKSDKLK